MSNYSCKYHQRSETLLHGIQLEHTVVAVEMKPPTLSEASSVLQAAFFAAVISTAALGSRRLFGPRHGRRHRVLGLVYVGWLVYGCGDILGRIFFSSSLRYAPPNYLVYDVVLGALGSLLTLTAAVDFGHEKVRVPKSTSSGALHPSATISKGEMTEHLFYQLLNLLQAMFLHAQVALSSSLDGDRGGRGLLGWRCGLLLSVTGLWWLRGLFPVNSFSRNYANDKRAAQGYSQLLGHMYRVKKYQYLFYKHFLLHGLNISFALRKDLPYFPLGLSLGVSSSSQLLSPLDLEWRLYWICLNTAYTFEFFLQTLVKRRHMRQRTMLILNQLSMLASSAAALQVLRHVSFPAAALSWYLNFANRHHEVVNSGIVVGVALAVNAAALTIATHKEAPA